MPGSRAPMNPLSRWAAPDAQRTLALSALLLEPVEERAILRRTVAALAAPGGLGFTRSFLFVYDAAQGTFVGRHAVGPADANEARRVAHLRLDEAALLAALRDLDDDALEAAAPESTTRVRTLALPLEPGVHSLLDECLAKGAARLGASTAGQAGVGATTTWGDRLALGGCAAALVRASDQPVALLIADRAFTGAGVSDDDVARLGHVARLAGAGVERARTSRLLAERGGQLATLDEAGKSAVQATSLRTELALLVRAATQTLSCRGGVLWRTAGERATLLLESVHVADDTCDPLREAHALEPLVRDALRERTARVVRDVSRDPRIEADRARGFGPALLAPVLTPGTAAPAGFLVLWNPAPHGPGEPAGFDRDDLRFAEAMAGTIGAVLAQSALSDRVRRAEERAGDTRKQLATAERLAALGELAARAAQEVKAPLASIGGFARRVHKGLAEGDPQREYVEIILRESERIERLLAEQMQFVRLSRPRLAIESVNQLLTAALTGRGEALAKKRVRVLKKFAPDVPALLLDAEKISQVVANMLDSALDNVPGNGRLRVESRRAQGYVVVEIAGEGPPLAGEMLEQLFVPFTTSRRSGESVGLALAQQVVQSHGGEIRVRSEGDWGVIFSFTLPVSENQDRRRDNDRRGVRNDRRNRFPAA